MVLKSDDFTEQAQDIVRRYSHSQWNGEHILMALLDQDEGVSVEIFNQLDVSVPPMRSRLDALLEQGPKVEYESSQIYVAPRSARLLERAHEEAKRLNDDYIGAEHLFDDEENMVRIDMSEYMEKHTVSRLIGAPPGYVGYDEGGQLTEAIRRRPFRVVLFDEVEKAHPDVFGILLQILEDGRLTDGHGRTVDFRNTLVIMTSNLGTGEIEKKSVGFLRDSDSEDDSLQLRASIEDALKTTFRPEFLNRIDEIIIFDPLTQHQIYQIVDLIVQEVRDRLSEHNVSISMTDAAKNWLSEKGYDPVYGARPLRRTIQRYVSTPLSSKILAGDFSCGDTILVDESDDALKFIKDNSGTEPDS